MYWYISNSLTITNKHVRTSDSYRKQLFIYRMEYELVFILLIYFDDTSKVRYCWYRIVGMLYVTVYFARFHYGMLGPGTYGTHTLSPCRRRIVRFASA